MQSPPPPPPRRRSPAGETLRRIVEREEGRRFDPERQSRMPRGTKSHHFAINASDGDVEKTAPIANADAVAMSSFPGGEPSVTLYRMWLGAYGTVVYVWADSFESAFEELVEYADEKAPGFLVTVDEDDLKAAAKDLDVEWLDSWPDWEDRDFAAVAEHAEADLTVIGHTTLKHGTHIPSWEWGGDEIETGSDEWWTVYERSLQEVHEARRLIAQDYEIVRGVIKSPGKFEGEAVYVPYFWSIVLEGGGEEFEMDGETVSEVEVEPDDEYAFPELARERVDKLWLWEDDRGFVRARKAGERPDEGYEENARGSLTKADVERMFREEVLPLIQARYEQDGRVDHPARAEAWNDYVDALQKDGMVTRHQASTWSNPF